MSRPLTPFALPRLPLLASVALFCFACGAGPGAIDAGSAEDAGGRPDANTSGERDGGQVDGEFCGDGFDDDGDDSIDEGCDCVLEATQGCWSGVAESRGRGVCVDGMQVCGGVEFPAWGDCTGELPRESDAETSCRDGLDEDCDGVADCDDPDCGGRACDDAGNVCVLGECTTCTPVDETCNGGDEDCDGNIDEGLTRACGTDEGVCMMGTETCTAGAWGVCAGATEPTVETCDGSDEDCDGRIDEDISGPESTACDGDDDDCDGVIDEWPCVDCSQIIRVAGTNRYETAADQSRRLFASSAGAAVVIGTDAAESDPNPDGVLAGGLAFTLGGPVLLTPRAGGLDPATRTELNRLRPGRVYLIGGTGSVSAQAESDIVNSLGIPVTRIRGSNRAETASLVAARVGAPSGRAFVVNGFTNFADAAVVAGLAGRLRYPILYVSADAVPAETSAAFSSLSINRTYVIGGTGAISAATMSALPNPTRLSGTSRYLTARAVADEAVGSFGVSPAQVALINAGFAVDAMTAAAAGNIHLYADMSVPIPAPTLSFLTTHRPDFGWLMGGRARFDAGFEGAFCEAVSR